MRGPTQLEWVRAEVAPLPTELRALALAKYTETHHATRRFADANRRLVSFTSKLADLPWGIINSDAGLRQHAERQAKHCQWAPSLEGSRAIAVAAGIAPPSDELTHMAQRRRLECARWWRRQLRARWGCEAENAMRSLGLVRRGRAVYVTDYTWRRRGAQKAHGVHCLESADIKNEEGLQLPLLDVVEKSVSNPKLRRTELMTRARGFEDTARELGHACDFWTLTCPSAFHPQLAAGGDNPRYNGATVQEARAWMQTMWTRARAKLKRLSVQYYGFRITEPHHDGTPHWHLSIHGSVAALDSIRTVLRAVWLTDYASEPGADLHRVSVKRLYAGESATGYLAKYIAKNIDGHGVGTDTESETDADTASARVEAWAATHRIRQFTQLGGPPVGLWREIRRLRAPVDSEPIERARIAAVESVDVAAFIRAVGGIDCGRRTLVRVWSEHTGELSRYGDVRPRVPVGVLADRIIRTRPHCWAIRWGVRLTKIMRHAQAAHSAPWTRSNNCTGIIPCEPADLTLSAPPGDTPKPPPPSVIH